MPSPVLIGAIVLGESACIQGELDGIEVVMKYAVVECEMVWWKDR